MESNVHPWIFLTKGKRLGALMLSLIHAWPNGWINSGIKWHYWPPNAFSLNLIWTLLKLNTLVNCIFCKHEVELAIIYKVMSACDETPRPNVLVRYVLLTLKFRDFPVSFHTFYVAIFKKLLNKEPSVRRQSFVTDNMLQWAPNAIWCRSVEVD